MSFVYRGHHVESGRLGAVKVLRPACSKDPKILQRFEQEARLAGQLQHKNIIQVLDTVIDPSKSHSFLVFEYLEGVDLEQISEQAPFDFSWIAYLMKQVCSALEASHAKGIVHRDLKPSNIFLCGSQEKPIIKLLDFGVAKILYPSQDKGLTETGEIIGTPAYIAPEQFLPTESITHKVDMYAVGVLLFKLLTGQLPLDGGSAIAHAVLLLRQEAPLLRVYRPDLADSPIEHLLRILLSKTPSMRPDTISDVWKQIEHALLGAESSMDDVKQEALEDVEEFGESTFVMPEGYSFESDTYDPELEEYEPTMLEEASLPAPELPSSNEVEPDYSLLQPLTKNEDKELLSVFPLHSTKPKPPIATATSSRNQQRPARSISMQTTEREQSSAPKQPQYVLQERTVSPFDSHHFAEQALQTVTQSGQQSVLSDTSEPSTTSHHQTERGWIVRVWIVLFLCGVGLCVWWFVGI